MTFEAPQWMPRINVTCAKAKLFFPLTFLFLDIFWGSSDDDEEDNIKSASLKSESESNKSQSLRWPTRRSFFNRGNPPPPRRRHDNRNSVLPSLSETG